MYLLGWILHGKGVRNRQNTKYNIKYLMDSTHCFTFGDPLGGEARWILDSYVVKAKIVTLLQRLDSPSYPGHHNRCSSHFILPQISDPI